MVEHLCLQAEHKGIQTAITEIFKRIKEKEE